MVLRCEGREGVVVWVMWSPGLAVKEEGTWGR